MIATRAPQPAAPRGATLIEMMVALSILSAVVSVTVGLAVGAIQSGARARARAELARQGALANLLFAEEIRMAGLGVPQPAGSHIEDNYGGAGNTIFDTVVILANADAVGIVGDFPRPDGQYNTLGALHNRPAGGRQNVMWHTENNGGCAPHVGALGTSCSTATMSRFFPGEDGCDAASDVLDRTCPWGMGRLIAGEHFQVVGGSQAWTHAYAASPLTADAISSNGLVSLRMGEQWSAAWPNVAPADFPVGISGQGFVTTIDRVFFRKTGTTVERIQCYGDPDPQHADWPNAATTTMPSMAALALTPTDGAANTCIGPEVIAQNVESLTFTYFDAAGAATTTKSAIRRVDWVLKLQTTAANRPVIQDFVGTAGIRNL